jgi:membrane fusion protein, heavy metal efflux system
VAQEFEMKLKLQESYMKKVIVPTTFGLALCACLPSLVLAQSQTVVSGTIASNGSASRAPSTFAAAKPSQANGAAPVAKGNEPLGCLIEPSVVVEVGSPVIGVIEKVHAERGDYVRKGQAVVQLDARVERASVAMALSRFDNEADAKSAKSTHEFAVKKADRTDSLYKQDIVSIQAAEQARMEARVAQGKLDQSVEAKSQSAKEVQLARAQLQQRTIVSPVSGVVVERYLSAGERVDDKPMMRIAQIDPLKVEVILPSSMYGKVKAGGTYSVTPELPGAGPMDAKVLIVDRVIDAASSTFRVRMEMANKNGALPSGLRCKVNMSSL